MKPILNLTIRRKWLDMIARGEKREEYRAINTRGSQNWQRRIHDAFLADDFATAIFRAGYRLDSPAVLVEIADAVSAPARSEFHPEWGEPLYAPHWVIYISQVLDRGPYEYIRRLAGYGMDGRAK